MERLYAHHDDGELSLRSGFNSWYKMGSVKRVLISVKLFREQNTICKPQDGGEVSERKGVTPPPNNGPLCGSRAVATLRIVGQPRRVETTVHSWSPLCSAFFLTPQKTRVRIVGRIDGQVAHCVGGVDSPRAPSCLRPRTAATSRETSMGSSMASGQWERRARLWREAFTQSAAERGCHTSRDQNGELDRPLILPPPRPSFWVAGLLAKRIGWSHPTSIKCPPTISLLCPRPTEGVGG